MKQHTTPCTRCPFRRTALQGWLGGMSPDEFQHLANTETRMHCHCAIPSRHREGVEYGSPEAARLPQCAGRAIYWTNQLKMPRDPSLLSLPRDPITVFEWPAEFVAHHKREKVSA